MTYVRTLYTRELKNPPCWTFAEGSASSSHKPGAPYPALVPTLPGGASGGGERATMAQLARNLRNYWPCLIFAAFFASLLALAGFCMSGFPTVKAGASTPSEAASLWRASSASERPDCLAAFVSGPARVPSRMVIRSMLFLVGRDAGDKPAGAFIPVCNASRFRSLERAGALNRLSKLSPPLSIGPHSILNTTIGRHSDFAGASVPLPNLVFCHCLPDDFSDHEVVGRHFQFPSDCVLFASFGVEHSPDNESLEHFIAWRNLVHAAGIQQDSQAAIFHFRDRLHLIGLLYRDDSRVVGQHYCPFRACFGSRHSLAMSLLCLSAANKQEGDGNIFKIFSAGVLA